MKVKIMVKDKMSMERKLVEYKTVSSEFLLILLSVDVVVWDGISYTVIYRIFDLDNEQMIINTEDRS